MTVTELKKQEFAYLKSGRENLRQYAIAYRDIIKIFNKDASNWLSDEMLLSKSAKKYMEIITEEYKLTQDNNLRLRAKAAADLFITKKATKDEVKELLKKNKGVDFEKSRNIIKKSSIYTKIDPITLEKVLSES